MGEVTVLGSFCWGHWKRKTDGKGSLETMGGWRMGVQSVRIDKAAAVRAEVVAPAAVASVRAAACYRRRGVG